MSEAEKTWWAPVWRGLVVDPEGKHYRRLRGAICLLLYLILHANRDTGSLVRKHETIVRDMGLSAWTIRYWMRRLRDQGYVRLSDGGRALTIQVLRWRSLRQPAAGLRGSGLPIREAKTHHAGAGGDGKTSANSGESEHATSPNKSISTKVFLQQRDDVQRRRSTLRLPNGVKAGTREELLAGDLARGLDDAGGFSRYLRYVHLYPESLLRRLLSEVRAVPEARIKRSRAALFTYLVKQHVQGDTENSRG